jgi:hypothetical protein
MRKPPRNVRSFALIHRKTLPTCDPLRILRYFMGALAVAGAVACFRAQGTLMLAGGLAALVLGCGWLSADWFTQSERPRPVADHSNSERRKGA